MREIEELLPQVIPYAPGCADPTASSLPHRQLRRALRVGITPYQCSLPHRQLRSVVHRQFVARY